MANRGPRRFTSESSGPERLLDDTVPERGECNRGLVPERGEYNRGLLDDTVPERAGIALGNISALNLDVESSPSSKCRNVLFPLLLEVTVSVNLSVTGSRNRTSSGQEADLILVRLWRVVGTITKGSACIA